MLHVTDHLSVESTYWSLRLPVHVLLYCKDAVVRGDPDAVRSSHGVIADLSVTVEPEPAR